MEKEIKDLTKDEMLNPGFVPSVLEFCETSPNKDEVLNEIMLMAKQYKITTKKIRLCWRIFSFCIKRYMAYVLRRPYTFSERI